MQVFSVGLDVELGKNKKIEMGVEFTNVVAECAEDAITGAKNYLAEQYKPKPVVARLVSVQSLNYIDLIY